MTVQPRDPAGRAPELNVEDLDPDPLRQFRRWFDEALALPFKEPAAMTLATATPDGVPSARMVLLRGIDERGLVFFTNYESRKGEELAANPRAALVLYWAELDRQIRVEGTVEKVSPEESDSYFHSRPRGNRLGAWASRQSAVIPDRATLGRQMEEFLARFPDGHVPRPPYWGGYRVLPTAVEFWQGLANRLHDRLRYRRTETGGWRVERLSP